MNNRPFARAYLIFLVLTLLAASASYYAYPDALVAILLGVNIATFELFAVDKAAARNGRLRVPERSLLIAALLGGAAGALCAIMLLRHKSSKFSFQFKLAIVLTMQIAAFMFWKQNF